jgi:hypothetical protein
MDLTRGGFTIGTQTGLASDEYSTVEGTPQTVSMKASNKEVKYTNTVDEKGCPLNGTGEKSNGTLSGKISLKATSESGSAINMFVGALTATQLCENAELKTCMSPYAIGTAIEANLSANTAIEFVLNKVATTVACTTSTIKGTTANPPMGGLTLGVTLTGYSFGNCGTTCATVTLTTPRAYFLKSGGGNGGFEVIETGGSAPTMTLFCGKESCSFAGSGLVGTVTGNAPATLAYASVPLKLDATSSAGCAGPLKFTASYNFTAPKKGGTAQMWLTG